VQDQDCHNINFVAPEHVVFPRSSKRVGAEHYPEINRRLTSPGFAEARVVARDLGLRQLDARRPRDYRAPSAFAARA
jgi:uncharacterized Fe-S radical SAM superfamily protein PflX